MPADALTVPTDMASQLDSIVASALTDVREWMTKHGDVNLFLLPYFVLDHLKPPPDDATQKAELEQLHRIADARTEPLTARAAWLADHGMHELWDGFLAEYAKKVGPAQARKAVQLLHDTLLATEGVGLGAKNKFMRKRPYVVDPTLKTVVEQPPDNPSYPSGHTGAAFAAAMVMSYLMPERADEWFGYAREMAYSRMYGGAHFPSDVLAGAYVGSFVGAAMIALSQQRDRQAAPAKAA
jgi:membrane-associated phospholipid phosphatase